MSKVRDIITDRVLSVASTVSLMEAAQQMKASGIGVIPVCDRGKLRGVITEREFVAGIADIAGDIRKLPVRLLMNKDYPVVQPGTDIVQAAKVMINNGVQVLPVEQNRKLLGLLSLDDLCRESPGAAVLVVRSTKKTSKMRR